jgi:RNA polymerase sigma-70 factor (ECF subfamily)
MTSAPTTPSASERRLLEAARRGDEGAYGRLVEPHRAELHAHCYRMLGSLHDAEDALQEALLRAWRGLGRFEGRSSARTWLYRIATNSCLDLAARRARARALPIERAPAAGAGEGPGEPLAEALFIEPYPDERLGLADGLAAPEARYERRESVELAFIACLQHLPPAQRAVLILREVLGFSAREAAQALSTSVASVNSALQRARRSVGERLPQPSQQATLRALGDAGLRKVVERYMHAMEHGDVDAVVDLLTEDATWSMPPLEAWYGGRDDIAAFLTDHALRVRWRHARARANGQAAVGCYAWDATRGRYVGSVLDVLTLRGPRIAAVTAFGTAEVFRGLVAGDTALAPSSLFRRFGLPDELPPSGPA